MRKIFQKNYGFTLLELVIYIGILSGILLVVVNTLLVVTGSYKDVRITSALAQGASDSIERMVREIRTSQSIDVAGSTLGSSPGVLKLNTIDSSENPTTIEFYVDGGVLKVREGGVYSGDLTLSDVSVTDLVFRRITTSVSEAVKIELTLDTTQGSESENYYSTATLRGSY